ncbi:hypothetical protein M405DRAFT_832812 [Rhizopogon salebrosus TDB-379]|nr:hypothetical protein M405DRAFT_832812 [Rhizopogon salebrosus TDB-379]
MGVVVVAFHPGFCSVYRVLSTRSVVNVVNIPVYPGLLRLLRQEAGGERGNLAHGVDDAEMRLGYWGEGAGMAKRGE